MTSDISKLIKQYNKEIRNPENTLDEEERKEARIIAQKLYESVTRKEITPLGITYTMDMEGMIYFLSNYKKFLELYKIK